LPGFNYRGVARGIDNFLSWQLEHSEKQKNLIKKFGAAMWGDAVRVCCGGRHYYDYSERDTDTPCHEPNFRRQLRPRAKAFSAPNEIR
jgi:hypothetical protein